jgi:PAS domain S-box-containing protein
MTGGGEDGETGLDAKTLGAVFNRTNDAIFIHDGATGEILSVNERAEELYGYTREEFMTGNVETISSGDPPFVQEEAQRRIKRAMDGEKLRFEWQARNATDEVFWVEVTLTRKQVGEEQRVLAVVRDIDERKRYAEQLEQREAELEAINRELTEQRNQYQALVEQSHDGIAIIQSYEFKFVNDRVAEMLGRSKDDLEGSSVLDVVAESDREIAKKRYEERLSGEEPPSRYDITLNRPSGDTFTANLTASTITYNNKLATFITVKDVTERRRQERELEKMHTRLQLALEETETGLWEWDIVEDTHSRDETSKRLIGLDPDASIDGIEEFYAQIVDEDQSKLEAEIDRVLETGDKYSVTFRVDPPHRDLRWVQSRGVLEYDENGEPERILGVQTDVTDLKEREQELKRQKERLDQFAGLVSHDLRNPLNVILGRLDAIETADTEHLDAIEDAAERMEAMITDLLALSRAGVEVGETEPVLLDTIARESWETVDTADAALEIECTDCDPIEAAPDRLRTLFENLFRNAIEHNDDSLTVRVGWFERDTESPTADVCQGLYIADDGAGIDPSVQGEIFEYGRTTKTDGTGYGLGIVGDVANGHGWEVSVMESEGGGARFEICIQGC